MRLAGKGFLSILSILLMSCLAYSQENNDEIVDPSPANIYFAVSVKSNKKGYLEDLKYRDFELSIKNQKLDIVFFIFDKPGNQYVIGFYEESFPRSYNLGDVRIKCKLPASSKEYGKIYVKSQRKYYPE